MYERGRIRVWILLGLAVAAGGLYLYSERVGREDATRPARPLDLPPETDAPVPVHPVPDSIPRDERDTGAPADAKAEPDAPRLRPPLPVLADSDAAVRAALEAVADPGLLDRWLRPARIIERTVVTIDSLDAAPLPLRFRPLEPVSGRPVVREHDSGFTLDPANARRYAPLVEGLEGTDPGELARVYFRFYPLFQEAYEALGYPDGYFNDRVVGIIDHLLAAPPSPAAPGLERPEVLYLFADPELEAASWGRKFLYRLSPKQDRTVRAWLRELRAEIAARPPEAGPLER